MAMTGPARRSSPPRIALAAALLVVALASTAYLAWRPGATLRPTGAAPATRERPAIGAPAAAGSAAVGGNGLATNALTRQVGRLTDALAAERAERQRLEQRLASVEAQLTDLYAAGSEAAATRQSTAPAAAIAAAGPDASAAAGSDLPLPDAAGTALERALVAAGLDPATAADIKRRRDELTMAEIILRDQATREQWLDTPRFQEAVASLEAQQTSIRDEIGDDGYDRYLAARGEPNRVRVDEVLAETPAAAAGLQAGDVVLRYGAARIFAPEDLVTETRSGTAGELVRVQVLRQGRRLEVEVPRGPLGLRIAASQGAPGEG
jgi:hypothetical protein